VLPTRTQVNRQIRYLVHFDDCAPACATAPTRSLSATNSMTAVVACVSDDLVGCLEAAIVAVDRLHVY
jgi:hypothetical protein